MPQRKLKSIDAVLVYCSRFGVHASGNFNRSRGKFYVEVARRIVESCTSILSERHRITRKQMGLWSGLIRPCLIVKEFSLRSDSHPRDFHVLNWCTARQSEVHWMYSKRRGRPMKAQVRVYCVVRVYDPRKATEGEEPRAFRILNRRRSSGMTGRLICWNLKLENRC